MAIRKLQAAIKINDVMTSAILIFKYPGSLGRYLISRRFRTNVKLAITSRTQSGIGKVDTNINISTIIIPELHFCSDFIFPENLINSAKKRATTMVAIGFKIISITILA